MPPITDTVPLVMAFSTWCVAAACSARTAQTVAIAAINRANPCDLAAVLGALPGVLPTRSRA
ncbi:hypothetical protein CNX65_04695 [Actinosynnema pretiosum]|uniref:Uncharacterized protein n=1 Tax=Actinosynnema pretiosum TaxID=42197 RepID=A0A290Z0W8_9PSEU|nr:hypothetical protein CNX65_04695 [Actinosynnema pretiosum]